MADNTNTKLCQEVEECIASVVDGELDDRLSEHLAGCDRCRDLRFDATNAARAIRSAGADYVHPEDFERKLIEKLDGLPSKPREAAPSAELVGAPIAAVAPAVVSAASEPIAAVVSAVVPAAPEPIAAVVSAVVPAATAPIVAPATVHAAEPAPRIAEIATPSKPVATIARRTGSVVALGIVGVASLAAAAAFAIHVRSSSTREPASAAQEAWSGRVVAARQAGPKVEGGLQRCSADGSGCAAMKDGTPIPAGSLLRTDARTRAHLEMSDGSRIALDRSTDFLLSARDGRVAEVRRGVAVADVMHLDSGPGAKFELPNGTVDVIGTKLTMTVSEDRSSVEVVRGVVKLSDKRGESVTIRAGEEGDLGSSGGPSVSAVANLSDGMLWSERSDVEEGPEDNAVRGLGELKARKPGASGELNQAVKLSKHDVKVRIAGSLARTEIDETFSNSTGDVLEGIYRFPLPPDAQIERLALEVDGHLEEGAFVDRDRAAAIWRGAIHVAAPKAPMPREEIVWVPGPWRDPALLEWQRGGRFELRIYPIPAHGSRRVILAYTQTIAPAGGARRYTYPLSYDASGSTRVEDFSIDVQVRGHEPSFGVRARGYDLTSANGGDTGAKQLAFSARSFVPSGDLSLEFMLPEDKQEVTAWAFQPTDAPALTAASDAGKPSDNGAAIADSGTAYVAFAVRPKLPRWADGKTRDQVIVVDASRSMIGERFNRAAKLAESIVREMDGRDRFAVLACDITCKAMDREFASPNGSAPQRVRDFLKGVEPDGGTDLVEAVRASRELAKGTTGERELRIMYLGDGTPSVGPVRPAHITSEVARVLPPGTGMLTAVAVGSDADSRALAAMARGGGGVMIPYTAGERATAVAVRVLGASYGIALRNPVIELPEGLTDVHPKVIDSIPAGGETIVVARMTQGSLHGSLKLNGQVGGEVFEQTFPIEVSATGAKGNAFVPRLYAATKIADLEANESESAKPEIIALSKRFAVASSHTSMLVLESAAMFRAFGLDRSRSLDAWSGEEGTVSTGSDGTTRYDAADGDEKEEQSLGRAGGGGAEAKKSKADASDLDMATLGTLGGSGEGYAAPPAAMPAATTGPMPRRAPGNTMACAPSDLLCQMDQARRGPSKTPPRGGWVAMRKVWDRKGSVASDASEARAKLAQQLASAESDAAANPDSRAKLQKVLGLYAVSGQLQRAGELAERWSTRDAMDPGALVARADIAARKGDRARAVRILSGMADLRPGDAPTQSWLAGLFESMGDSARACSFRIALGSLKSTDAPSVAAAIRCARSVGRSEIGDSLLRDVTQNALRTSIETELGKSALVPALKGDFKVEATWDADVDLDIALIGKNGERYSWLGDPKGRVTARDATSRRSEAIAIANAPAADYVIELTRADGGELPVRGSITVTVPGGSRTIPFNLAGQRVEAGSARIFFTSRLVPANMW